MGATRRQLLRSGLAGAGTLTLAGSGLGMFARTAHAAVVPDSDLAYLRLLAAAELLKADFQTAARRSAQLPPRPRALLARFHADDTAHYDALATLTKAAGQPPPAAGDIDFSYPVRTFATARSTLELAVELTTLTLGGYLGAIEGVQTASVRLPLGQIAANEAQQLGALRGAAGRAAVGHAFASALSIDAVSARLDRFES